MGCFRIFEDRLIPVETDVWTDEICRQLDKFILFDEGQYLLVFFRNERGKHDLVRAANSLSARRLKLLIRFVNIPFDLSGEIVDLRLAEDIFKDEKSLFFKLLFLRLTNLHIFPL